MASRLAVAQALGVLGRVFGGTIDDERVLLYHAALDDLTDDELKAATVATVKSHRGPYLPAPAVLRDAVGANRKTAVDAETIIGQIADLSVYTAARGMVRPPRAVVARELGEAIAWAYATAGGGDALFADGPESEQARSIARREFRRALEEAAAAPGDRFPVLGAGSSDVDAEFDRLVADVAHKRALPGSKNTHST